MLNLLLFKYCSDRYPTVYRKDKKKKKTLVFPKNLTSEEALRVLKSREEEKKQIEKKQKDYGKRNVTI